MSPKRGDNSASRLVSTKERERDNEGVMTRLFLLPSSPRLFLFLTSLAKVVRKKGQPLTS